ncbi:MAG TPA: twin-arginine translocation signal domain-containing protein [Kribbella sp.]|nr:twin-arginine translocation signal domain-containing protein [Kribbella sp.]
MSIERRTFLRESAAVTGGVLAAGPFQGLVARVGV